MQNDEMDRKSHVAEDEIRAEDTNATWQALAGRRDGPTGYQFGDVTRTVTESISQVPILITRVLPLGSEESPPASFYRASKVGNEESRWIKRSKGEEGRDFSSC